VSGSIPSSSIARSMVALPLRLSVSPNDDGLGPS
jgi:hypothetical protein